MTKIVVQPLARALFIGCASLLPSTASASDCPRSIEPLKQVAATAERFESLRTLHVAVDGDVVVAKGFRGHSPQAATNVKSASKTLIAAVVGAAIQRGFITDVNERVVDALPNAIPSNADPALEDLTVEHLLSMQGGLARTSG